MHNRKQQIEMISSRSYFIPLQPQPIFVESWMMIGNHLRRINMHEGNAKPKNEVTNLKVLLVAFRTCGSEYKEGKALDITYLF